MVSFGRIALFAFYRFSSSLCTGFHAFHWATTRLSSRRLLVNTILPFTGIATLTVDSTATIHQQQHFRLQSNVKQPKRVAMCSTSKNSVDEEIIIDTGYLNAKDAYALDQELMSTPGFSLEQLMELAGLSVAEAVYAVETPTSNDKKKKVLLVCGPGNNGGDGLVAARHLVMFGYECTIVYPKKSKNPHFINLVQQCEDLDIPILDSMPSLDIKEEGTRNYDVIVDAIFGFSFKGKPREPFASALTDIIHAQKNNPQLTILSVDVPSGWNVDDGDVAEMGFMPQVLISLTAPKLSAKNFKGRHFVGGRFLPPKLAAKYNIKVRKIVISMYCKVQHPERFVSFTFFFF